MYTDDGQTPRNRRRHSRATRAVIDMEAGQRLSPGLHHPDQPSPSQSLRQRARNRKSRNARDTKSPVLSLAERIMIAKLDPENFSMETTSSKEVQQAVAMTPRPGLSSLIHQYRSLESEEQQLEHSMLDRVQDAHHCLRSVAHSLQSLDVEDSSSVIRSASPRVRRGSCRIEPSAPGGCGDSELTGQSVSTHGEQNHVGSLSPSVNVGQYHVDQSASGDGVQYQTTNQTIPLKDVEQNPVTNESASKDVKQYQTTNLSNPKDVEQNHTTNQLASNDMKQYQTTNQSIPKAIEQHQTTTQRDPEEAIQYQSSKQPTSQLVVQNQFIVQSEEGQYQVTNPSPSQEAKQYQTTNQSGAHEARQHEVSKQSSSQTAVARQTASQLELKAEEQHTRPDRLEFQELQQSSAQSMTCDRQNDRGRQTATVAENWHDGSNYRDKVDLQRPPALSDSKPPAQDFTKENSVTVHSYSENVRPQEKPNQTREAKNSLHLPKLSVIEETPQNREIPQPTSSSLSPNSNSELPSRTPEEAQSKKQGETTAPLEKPKQLLAEKRAAYLQRHSKTTNEKKQGPERDTEQCHSVGQTENFYMSAQQPSQNEVNERKDDTECTQFGLQAKLQQSNRHEADKNDVTLRNVSSHNVSLPAIENTIARDPAANTDPNVNSATPFLLPSIAEATHHLDSEVNTDRREKDDDERFAFLPSSIQEKGHLPGSENSGNDDINLAQVKCSQRPENDQSASYHPRQGTSQAQQFMTPKLSSEQSDKDKSLSKRENTLGPDLSHPSPTLTSNNHQPLQRNTPQIENNNTPQHKADTGQTSGQSINIFIGDTTPPSLLSGMDAKADEIRLPVVLDRDPRESARVSSQDDATRHNSANEKKTGDMKLGDHLSIEISSEGDVCISTYSKKGVFGETGDTHSEKKVYSGQCVSEGLGHRKENCRKKENIPSQDKKKQRRTKVRIGLTDKVHVHHANTNQQKHVTNVNVATTSNRTHNYTETTALKDNFNKNATSSVKRNGGNKRHNSNQRETTDHSSLPRHSSFGQSEDARIRNQDGTVSSCCCHSTSHTFSSVARVHFDTESQENSSSDTDDDDDDDDQDDRIYDFIGLSRRRSYTLPEIVTRKSVSPSGVERQRHRVRDNPPFSILHLNTKPFLPKLGSQHQKQNSAVPSFGNSSKKPQTDSKPKHDNNPSLFKLPTLRVGGGGSDTLRSQLHGLGRSEGQGQVKLPHLMRRQSMADHGYPDMNNVAADRQRRVLGLYHELQHINVHSTRPSTLRLHLTRRRSSQMDMRIEWGRRLPEGDSTLKIKYHTKSKKTPKSRSLLYERKRFRRNYSDNFIFLDDDIFPKVELRHSGEGFCPDVKWFLRPGEASEKCDVGFADGRLRDRKTRAWTSLKNKCLSRVHVMKSLEMKSFAQVPKLKLNERPLDLLQ